MTPDTRQFRHNGRIAGVLYLVVVLSGMFCLAYVPAQVGTTLTEASTHAGLFRAGIAAFLLMQVAFLLLPLALYRVLGDVDRPLAALMVAFAAVSVPIGLVAMGILIKYLPPDGQRKQHQLDLAGTGYLTLSVAALLLALLQAEVLGYWALGLIALAVCSALLLIRQERRTPEPQARARVRPRRRSR